VPAWLAVVLAVFAGTGWLYVLRDSSALAIGPRIVGALPLQQLAGNDGQPLAALVVAWLPAGALAGAALARWTRVSRAGIALGVAAVAMVLLFAAGAASDAAAISEPVFTHLGAQLGRTGTWTAIGLMALGSLLGASTRGARARGAGGRRPRPGGP
jgi:hypothetical protein